MNSTEGTETELYGYALHVEVIGQKNGKTYQYILTHTHPASDGSEPGWEKLRSYTRNVGIPMSIGAILLAQGKVEKTGVITPEEAFDPKTIFSELQKRRLIIHEQKTELTKQ
jgi:saccharopine dehydrogenase-like NADP-dependent oxidoreductase